MCSFYRKFLSALLGFPAGRLAFLLSFVVVSLFSVPASAKAPKPTGVLALILIRDALSALNQANWTGNYTVLRDYASPNFARNNDPVRLTAIFQPIRAQALNLAPTLYLTPKITKAELTNKGTRLKIKGFFPSKPKQIHFDLIFEPIVNRWRLFGIGVWAVEPKVAGAKPVRKLKIDEAVPASTSPNVTVPKAKPGG